MPAYACAPAESIRIGPKGFGQPAKLDANKDLAWVQGRLIFENCPMSEVLAELRRYYPAGSSTPTTNSPASPSPAITGSINPWTSCAHWLTSPLPSSSEYPALVILN